MPLWIFYLLLSTLESVDDAKFSRYGTEIDPPKKELGR